MFETNCGQYCSGLGRIRLASSSLNHCMILYDFSLALSYSARAWAKYDLELLCRSQSLLSLFTLYSRSQTKHVYDKDGGCLNSSDSDSNCTWIGFTQTLKVSCGGGAQIRSSRCWSWVLRRFIEKINHSINRTIGRGFPKEKRVRWKFGQACILLTCCWFFVQPCEWVENCPTKVFPRELALASDTFWENSQRVCKFTCELVRGKQGARQPER